MQCLEGAAPPARCAIYARKSFQPPRGQEVTSIETQRAICSSYIASQQHKGWIELPKRYEDWGRSGANLDRPALQELISDVETGLVEIVLVYKLDRISRTLLDFVRLMDFFERYGVVFVAITQNFDTSDSLGRLVRNVLLTFAQFEREITTDRMLDKRMLMKRKGLWTGGDAPVGYDLRRGKLLPNALEAPAVRCIFETYVATKRVSRAHKELIARGYRRKIWKNGRGNVNGGGPIGLTSLHHILRNPVYIGEVTYRGERFPGIHQPIVERDLWDAVQLILKEREQFRPRQPSYILTGLLFDSHGRRMHGRDYFPGAPKRKRGVRHYESRMSTDAVGQRLRACRAQADQLERLVLEALKELLADRTRIGPVLMQANIFGSLLDDLNRFAPAAAARIGSLSVHQLSRVLKALLARIEVAEDCVRLVIRAHALAKFIGWDGIGYFTLSDLELARATRMHVLVVPAVVMRSRRLSWLPVERKESPGTPDPKLLQLLQDARTAQDLLYSQRDKSVHEVARLAGRRVASFSRLVRLNYLAPDIISAIVDGTQPETLTRRRLIECDLPIDWQLQRKLLDFPPRQTLPVLGQSASMQPQPE
jgi:DNA invertase Pin-like site-specific DNA recombinase